jgi:NTP pyrophosphatase (non-canonical NTP hydrolase)
VSTTGTYVEFVRSLEQRPGEVIVGNMYNEIAVCCAHLGPVVHDLKKLLFYRKMHEEEIDGGRGNIVVEKNVRLLHAALGLLDEAIEFFDRVYGDIGTGNPEADPDKVNLVEELGDIAWYATQAEDELNVTHEEVLEANVEKLQARYPGGFTLQTALNRDRGNERRAVAESIGA